MTTNNKINLINNMIDQLRELSDETLPNFREAEDHKEEAAWLELDEELNKAMRQLKEVRTRYGRLAYAQKKSGGLEW